MATKVTPTAYILSLPERSDRKATLIPQLLREGIRFEFVAGIKDQISFRGVSNAHKGIIRAAKERGDEYVIVLEDDVVICEGAWKYFIDNIPADFDLYFGSVANGYPDKDGYCRDFRGLFFFCCHSMFYDRFLSVADMNHLDSELSQLKDTKYILLDPMAGFHSDGYSDNAKQHRTYGNLWEGRKFYNNGNS